MSYRGPGRMGGAIVSARFEVVSRNMTATSALAGRCSVGRALLWVGLLCGIVSSTVALSQALASDAPPSKARLERPLTSKQAAALQPGETFRECAACPRMIVAPPGRFMMGSNKSSQDERPIHQVTIAQAFAAGVYEVTVAEYMACVTERACRAPQWRQRGSYYNIETGSDDHYKKLGAALTDPRHPIVGVSWRDAQQFLGWLNDKVSGTPYRLLTEAEWEYIARAGTGRQTYWWGNRFSPSYANAAGTRWWDRWAFTSPVGAFPANPFGFHDLHGNVWEWVEDCPSSSYVDAPTDGTADLTQDCGRRVLRGGSWYFVPRLLRSADRFSLPFVNRLSDIGLRVARTLASPASE